MPVKLVQLWLLLALAVPSTGSIAQFYMIVKNVGGIQPASLTIYGCYCGLGSTSNRKVVDCLDKCCYHHDNCYGSLKVPCPNEYSYYSFVSYEIDSSYRCVEGQDECKYKLCKCDYDFGVCVGQYKRLYKANCAGVRNEKPCRRGANYTLPDCENGDIDEMIEETKDICVKEKAPTSTSKTSTSTTSTSTTTTPTTTTSTTTTSTTTTPTTTKGRQQLDPDESREEANSSSTKGLNSSIRLYANEALTLSLLALLLSPRLLA